MILHEENSQGTDGILTIVRVEQHARDLDPEVPLSQMKGDECLIVRRGIPFCIGLPRYINQAISQPPSDAFVRISSR